MLSNQLLYYTKVYWTPLFKKSEKFGESGEKFDDEDYFMDTSDIDEKELNDKISDIVSLQCTNFNNDLSMN